MRSLLKLLPTTCLFIALAAAQNQDVRITNGPTVEHVTSQTATIAWSTNVNSGTLLRYGVDPNNLDQTAKMPWGGFTHRVSLKHLQPNRTYYFQAQSPQGQGTGSSAASSILQFQTNVEDRMLTTGQN